MTAFAAALAWALIGLPQAGGAAEPIVLQLSGPTQFEFAGYYAALWQGFYRDAGLDVTIRPGSLKAQSPTDPVREVAEGRAQFGTGTMQLVIRRAQGLPILLVAPIFQQSGAAIYYRSDSDFSSPAALVNARIGRLAASDILDIELATALRGEGIDPTKIKSATIDASQIMSALADHSIDAAVGSAWTVPWQAHEHGLVLKSFNPANYRVEYYGDSLFTMQHFEATEPQTVSRFRAASLKGWEFALLHPNEVIARLLAEKSAEAPVADMNGFDRYQADVARRLARYPDIPLGYSNPDRWTQIEAGMIGAGVLARTADLTSFVYNPGEEAAQDGARSARLVPLAVAILLGAAVIVAAFWFSLQFWRRRASARAARVEPQEQTEAAPAAVVTLPRALQTPPPAPEPPAPPPPPPALPAPISLNDVLAPLERRIRQRMRGKVRFRYSLLPELWLCRTEGGAVAAAVLDLVAAATTAMDADGALIVGTRNFAFNQENIGDYPGGHLGEFARITVRDNGSGLTDVQFEQVTDPAATARPAIPRAAAVMQRLGGFLRVESAEGVGTAVHLYFARVADAAGAAPAGAAHAPNPTAQVAE
jgi:ABC-type nitrate/sulfonate/bicarbonate transport system substrate-binding protein